MPVGGFPTGRCLSRDRETQFKKRRDLEIPVCRADPPFAVQDFQENLLSLVKGQIEVGQQAVA